VTGTLRPRGLVYAIAAVVCLVGRWPCLLDFLIGAALAELYCAGRLSPRAGLRPWVWIVIGLFLADTRTAWITSLLTQFAATGPAGKIAADILYSALVLVMPHLGTLAAALLIVGVLQCPTMNVCLPWRPLLMLGRWSFCLYLFHLPVLNSLGAMIYIQLSLRTTPALAIATSTVLTIAMSLLVAILGTKLLDEPSQRLSRWFLGRILARRTGPADPASPVGTVLVGKIEIPSPTLTTTR
ncbi:MAG: acyltransferase family protein, partial [Gemmataceae bacterium]